MFTEFNFMTFLPPRDPSLRESERRANIKSKWRTERKRYEMIEIVCLLRVTFILFPSSFSSICKHGIPKISSFSFLMRSEIAILLLFSQTAQEFPSHVCL